MDNSVANKSKNYTFFQNIERAKLFAKDPLGFQKKSFEEEGDCYYLKLGPKKIFVTRDAGVFAQVLQLNHKNYTKDFAMHQLSMALGNGLLTNDGESWLHQRRLAQPAFHKKRLEGMLGLMYEIALEHIKDLKSRTNHTPTFIDQEMMALTSDIAIQTLLGMKKNEELIYMQKSFVDIQEHIVKRIRRPFFIPLSYINGSHGKATTLIKSYDKIIYKIIDEKEKNPGENDLISMLLASRDEDTGEGMSKKQLRDELITIYVAGHETSGYTLSWAFYAISQNKEIYNKIKEEVKPIFEEGFNGIESIKKLVYTRQVVDETLRKYPTAYILSRQCKANDKTDDVEIPGDYVVLLSTFYLHRNTKFWKDPEVFDPERFGENGDKEAIRKAYYPFGGGPRMCIGNNFALWEITLVLAMMMYHFDFEYVENQKIEFQPLVTLKPKYGIQLNLKPIN
ncbi:MAG: cytochrome P450 [Bacteroidetes bacterium]|nr:cytochrome P450 [Bacteroidota bacterium]